MAAQTMAPSRRVTVDDSTSPAGLVATPARLLVVGDDRASRLASAWPDDSLAPAYAPVGLRATEDWAALPDKLEAEFEASPTAKAALVLLDVNSAVMSPAAFASLLDTTHVSTLGRCIVWATPDSPEWNSSSLAQVLDVRKRSGAIRSFAWSGKTTHAGASAVARQATELVASCPAAPLPDSPGGQCLPADAPARLPQDSSMLVNVFNSTWRNGLARQTAWQLASRNISVAAVANDPWGAYIPGVADVRFGKPGRETAWALALHIPGARLVNDGRTSTTVDLVLGQSFTGLEDPRAVRTARDATRSCPPVD